jgi:hypothetical protein
MTSEKFTNLGESTLASAYTSGGSSITVVSAATFPTAGVFRVRLDNPSETIFRVDSVSGAVFTGGAEDNDGNADAGVAAVHVATAAVAERFLQSPESGEARSPHGASGAFFVGPFQFPITALSQSSWTWVNQGSAAYSESGGTVYITCPTATGTNLRGRHKSMSGITSVTMGIIPELWGVAAAGIRLMAHGILLRESGTGELTFFAMANFAFSVGGGSPTIVAYNFNSPTSGSAAIAERSIGVVPLYNFLRVTDSGGNLTFYHSLDKVNWYQFAQVSRTSFMAGGPDQIGWGIFNQASAGGEGFVSTIFSWEES